MMMMMTKFRKRPMVTFVAVDWNC